MRTEYHFTLDGRLIWVQQANGSHVYTVNRRDELGELQFCSMIVTEDGLSEREFFNHFGDDSSWPEGWWVRLTADPVTKKRMVPPTFTLESWRKENYL